MDGCLCVGGVAGELWLAPINIGLNKPLGRIHRNNNVISNSVFPLAFRFICFFSRQISDPISSLMIKALIIVLSRRLLERMPNRKICLIFLFLQNGSKNYCPAKISAPLSCLLCSASFLCISRLLHLKQANRWCQIGGCTRHLIALHMYKPAIAINILWHLPEPLINNASGSAFTN